ncbi:MAG: hypothetical protein ABSF85_05670 [Terriglobales bacterium]
MNFWTNLFGGGSKPLSIAPATLETKSPASKASSTPASASAKTLVLKESQPATTLPVPDAKAGSNWYFAEDQGRCLRQVVLISDPKLAVTSRYGNLLLTQKNYELNRNPLATGLVHLDGDARTFLLVRTDRIVEEVSKSSLKVAFSFFHLPMSGLVAIYVSCKPLQEKTRMGFEEQVYGLDFDATRDLISNAIKGDALHVVHAGEGGIKTTVMPTGETMCGPSCKYDVDITYENDCKSLLADEWNAVLRHHRSIRNPNFQAAGKRLYELMPENANPILEGNRAAFLVCLRGSGIDRQQVLDAVSEWKGNHESSFAANLDMRIGRHPKGDVVMISTRTEDCASYSELQTDLDSTFQRRGIPLLGEIGNGVVPKTEKEIPA